MTKVDSPSPYVFSGDKREGMGLLEYQAMPSLRDVLDGVSCTFSKRAAPDQGKWCGPSWQAAWTVQHVQNHTLLGHSPPASQAAAVLGQPFSLRSHWWRRSGLDNVEDGNT